MAVGALTKLIQRIPFLLGLGDKTVSFYTYGGVGLGGDDSIAMAAAIAAVKADRRLRLVQNGGYWKTSQTLDLTVPGDFAIVGQEPRHWHFNCTIEYTGINKAIDVRGGGFGHSGYVDTLIGQGVAVTGVVGGTEENMGLHIGRPRRQVADRPGWNVVPR